MEPAKAKTQVAPLLVAWTTLFRTSLIGILKIQFAPNRTEQYGTHVVARRETWQQTNETDLRSWKTDRRDRSGGKRGKERRKRKKVAAGAPTAAVFPPNGRQEQGSGV
jgi:PAB1-binding protein PBP1